MVPDRSQLALKEWAVTVGALAQGHQILLLRKGGIREEGKHFRIIHPEFLLYPTYEHQREDLLKLEYQPSLHQVLEEPPQGGTITFSYWARAEEVIELLDQGKVDDLSPHYIWTNAYAQSRLHWKPRFPLSVMLLRVYRIEQPVSVPYLAEYGGCKSWVNLASPVPLGRCQPVLSEADFQHRVAEIKGSLGLAAAAR